MGRYEFGKQVNKYYENKKKNKGIKKQSKIIAKTYNCTNCSYQAKNKILLQHHVCDFHKTCEYAGIFKCSNCSYKTIMKQNYSAHIKKHKKMFEEDFLYCAHCPFKIKGKSNLRNHMSRHFLKSEYKCLFCSYSTNRQSVTFVHQWVHPEYRRDTIYQCIYCSYMTRIKSHFERHHNIHKRMSKPEEIPVFKCIYCTFKCFHKSSLDRHNLGHERKKGVQCKHCSYTAKTLAGVALHKKYHVQENNSEEYINKKYKCTTCPYQTNKLDHYYRHLSTHEDFSNGGTFKCVLCSFKCRSRLSLDKHSSSHTTDNANLKCSKCSFSSNRLAAINSHMIAVHQEKVQPAKLFACSSCRFTTIKQSDLKRHATRHQDPEEIDWIWCNECPFKAKRKYQLANHCKGHKLTVGIKCSYCSYHSSTKTCSWNHLRLHL